MRTIIVYVLVSTDKDIYLEQAYISMLSVRHNSPGSKIILLTDCITAETFKGFRKEMANVADNIITVNLPSEYSGMERSRMLKTSVRKHVSGDLLFIDCDTVVTRPLDDIDNCQFNIAACRDTHSNFIENPYRELCVKHAKILQWPIEEEKTYFNSGVIYVKDTPETHDFYESWNRNWMIGREKRVYMDQPSFALTNYQSDHIVKVLDDHYNCELKHGARYLHNPYIIHYLCTNTNSSPLFILNDKHKLEEIKRTKTLPPDIEAVISNPYSGIDTPTLIINGDTMQAVMNPYISSIIRNRNTFTGRIFRQAWQSLQKINRLFRH